MFAPAVSLLADAAQLLARPGAGEGAAEADAQAAAVQEVTQLAARALASMHAALEQQRQALAGGDAAGGGYWRSNPQALSPAEAAEAACSTSASLCSLLTTLRLHASGVAAAEPGSSLRRQQLDALAAAAAADLRLLAPYGPSGALDSLAGQLQQEAEQEEQQQQGGSSTAALSTLVLYCGAAKHGAGSTAAAVLASAPAASAAWRTLPDPWPMLPRSLMTPFYAPPPFTQSWWASETTSPAWWPPAGRRQRRGSSGRRRWRPASRLMVSGQRSGLVGRTVGLQPPLH